MYFKNKIKYLLVCALVLATPGLFAAEVDFLKVEKFFIKPGQPVKIFPYAINLASTTRPISKSAIQYLNKLESKFVYLTRVAVDNKLYYRLVMGNFKSLKQAKRQLARIDKYYPGSWINIRPRRERKQLVGLLSVGKKVQAVQEIALPKISKKSKSSPRSAFADKLLKQAKQKFLDGNYPRVLAITDKIIEIGSEVQIQEAMEIAGIVRERQNKFAQAVAIYTSFLELFPNSELSPRIKSRLDGLKTMRMDPKKRLARDKPQSDEVDWVINGALTQYYRSDLIDRENAPREDANSALVSDINMYALRKTETETLVVRFDGGLIRDIEEGATNSRVSRATVAYTDRISEYQVIGGRQSRTAKGVLQRFDGVVYKDLSNSSYNYSVYTGFPVQSSHDGLETEHRFIGSSVNFNLFSKVEMDVYFLHQDVSGLTDRRALGTEFQYRGDRGFLYGILDYDLFYGELNNFTAVGNYRYGKQWVLNLTYNLRKSPLLSTTNALQGQSVATISELQTLFTDAEIYQLAEDRSADSQNVHIGTSYQVDADHQLNLSASFSSIEATVASGGVAAVPATDDVYLAGDYTIHNYFKIDDYTSFGLSLSDTSSSNVMSLRARSRFPGSKGFRYDARVRLDYRQSNDTDVRQWILSPSFRVSYRPSKKLSFEGTLSLEYSNFNLPDLDDQLIYTLFLGYVYQF